MLGSRKSTGAASDLKKYFNLTMPPNKIIR